MIGRCETCPHWSAGTSVIKDGEYSPEWGDCAVGCGSDGRPVLTETLVFASDQSAYAASLFTHKTFGCVMHPQNKE